MHTCTLACLLANLSKGMLAEHRPARACASRPPCVRPQGPPPVCLSPYVYAGPATRSPSRLAPQLHTHPPPGHIPTPIPACPPTLLHTHPPAARPQLRTSRQLHHPPHTHARPPARVCVRAAPCAPTRRPGRPRTHIPPCVPTNACAPARRRRLLAPRAAAATTAPPCLNICMV